MHCWNATRRRRRVKSARALSTATRTSGVTFRLPNSVSSGYWRAACTGGDATGWAQAKPGDGVRRVGAGLGQGRGGRCTSYTGATLASWCPATDMIGGVVSSTRQAPALSKCCTLSSRDILAVPASASAAR